MREHFSEFHEIGGLTADPDDNGMTERLFGEPRAGEVEPTILTRADGFSIALPTFEFGLVLAGAVSAGAYTAGVMDYLVETLDRWEAQKQADFEAFGMDFAKWSVPPHAVRLRAVAGASAGSVVGAILGATASGGFPSGASLSPEIAPQTPRHGDKPPAPHRNAFYNVWVRQLDIRDMLQTADIRRLGEDEAPNPRTGKAEPPIHRLGSMLNVAPLDTAAAQTVDFRLEPLKTPRPWLDHGVRFAFTLGNLQGVPYRYQLVGLEGAQFATTRHADLFRFSLAGSKGPQHCLDGGCKPCEPLIEGDPKPGDGDWKRVAEAALASAAFPVALQSRWLEKPAWCNSLEVQFDPRFRAQTGVGGNEWAQPADIVAGYVNSTFEAPQMLFPAVDGGTMNNQPFEYVRRTLSGALGRNPREGHRANRAVLLIDPFPAPSVKEQEEAAPDPRARMAGRPLPVLEALPRLFSAYTAQARYDANDLILATSDGVYSRYMLSPMRADPTPGSWDTLTGDKAIASGSLGAFAGFLSESFRHHDFLLGRRNAENFLRNYFSVTQSNPLFKLPVRVGDKGPANPKVSHFWTDKGNEREPYGPYWTITCDGEGKHERTVIAVPIPRDQWAEHGPATNLPFLRAESDAVRLEMERARKLAVRKRLLSPVAKWPDPAGQADALVDELHPLILGRTRAIVRLIVSGFAKEGAVGLAVSVMRRFVEPGAAKFMAGKLESAIRDGLRPPA